MAGSGARGASGWRISKGNQKIMKNGDYSLKRIGSNSLGAVDNYWFPHLFTPKVASSALEILARCPTLLRFPT
ncbi:hypothetical protein A7Q00_09715 [Eikenella halliae]|uniref:Uncharacterized protein n=1 Tax=Eikenella halliae TaxID=1795832 RepID=A0A1B6VWQ7_9NEIS|nr:hypothetical protein A7Q00_09715 [Eikenella halliae]